MARPSRNLKRVLRAGLLLLAGLFGGIAVSAQSGALETLVTEDGAFQFTYPADWTAEERPDGAIDLSADDAFLTVYTPNYLSVSGLFPADMRSTGSFMDSFKETATEAGVLSFEPSVKVALTPGMTAVRSDFRFAEQPASDPIEGAQFMLAVPVLDRYVLVMAVGPDDEDFTDAVYAMAQSFDILIAATPTPGSSPGQSGAAGLPTDWRELTRLLQAMDLISRDGALVWSAAYASTSVGGPLLLPDDSLSEYPNMAGGALLSFRPEDDVSICGLVSRVSSAQGSEEMLFVGVSGSYELLVMAVSPENADDPPVQWIENDLSFFNPQQMVYVLRDNRLTVLINGEIVAEDLEVVLPEADAQGNAPEGKAGAILEMSCVMTDAWAYGFGN